jgi:hypothetical protein
MPRFSGEHQTGYAWLLYLSTRWFSKYDVAEYLFHYFGDVQALLQEMVRTNILPATSGKLLNLFEDDIVQNGMPKLNSVHMLSAIDKNASLVTGQVIHSTDLSMYIPT